MAFQMPRRRACPECGATGSVLAGPREERGWCEGCKAFVSLPQANKRRLLLILKAVFNVAVGISTIAGAMPVYNNLVNSVRDRDALALLDKADKQFGVNERQISDWLSQHAH